MQQSTSSPVNQCNGQPVPAASSVSPPVKLPDFTGNCRVVPIISNKKPREVFDLIFFYDIMADIHQQTNLYANHYLQNKSEYLQQHPHSLCTTYQAKAIELREMKAALAMIIIKVVMGLLSLPCTGAPNDPSTFRCSL